MSANSIVLITGGHTGLGYAIVEALCKSETLYTVVIASRKIEAAQDAVARLRETVSGTAHELVAMTVDVESDESIQRLFEDFSARFDRLDVLINNAGASFDQHIDMNDISSMRKHWNRAWDTNVTGANIMTHVFAPLLIKSSNPRLLFITSGLSSLEQTLHTEGMSARINLSPEAGWPKKYPPPGKAVAYRSAKTGLNMMAREWAKDLKHDGVKVFIVSPGFLATNLLGLPPETMKRMGADDPASGGGFVKRVIEGERDEHAGLIVRYFGESHIQPW